jgi:hypothetical protein
MVSSRVPPPPDFYPVGNGVLSPGIKRPGCEADLSPPSNAEVKNVWSYASTPPIRLHGVLVKYRNNFILRYCTCA